MDDYFLRFKKEMVKLTNFFNPNFFVSGANISGERKWYLGAFLASAKTTKTDGKV